MRGVAFLAWQWAVIVGCWWLFAWVALWGEWAAVWEVLAGEFDPVRRWLFCEGHPPKPVPLREPVYYQPSEPG